MCQLASKCMPGKRNLSHTTEPAWARSGLVTTFQRRAGSCHGDPVPSAREAPSHFTAIVTQSAYPAPGRAL
jgi:hypothetical protein